MYALTAVPNVSEGQDPAAISRYAEGVTAAGARVLDIHSDAVHNRSVLTATGPTTQLIDGMVSLATACSRIDLTAHRGVHPRLGGLDVCPFVPLDGSTDDSVAAAKDAAARIYEVTGVPVYLYGDASSRSETRELPALRRGGLGALMERARRELPPDHGVAAEIDPHRGGVICVGARGVLIAFNVWLSCETAEAEDVANAIRAARARPGSGLSGVRALGLQISPGVAQVSMNITDPEATSIDEAFQAVALRAEMRGLGVIQTELVGLVPERYLPNPDAAAAQLLMEPGRSLESSLAEDR